MAELFYTGRAAKDIQSLEPVIKDRVRVALEALARNEKQGKPLVGDLKGLWSLRVGKCRIIYGVESDDITVITVRFRRESYR